MAAKPGPGVGFCRVRGVLTAVLGFLLKGLIPSDLPAKIGVDAVESILNILATLMLTITIFALCDCFVLGEERSFDQDPRYGMQVQSEIGQRALSPGINDPGTARLALQNMLRILTRWAGPPVAETDYPRLLVPPVKVSDLLQELLLPIARDSADNSQIQREIQHSIVALARISLEKFSFNAKEIFAISMEYAESHIPVRSQLDLLRDSATRLDEYVAP